MALSNLALTQQKLGDLPAAEKATADSLKLLQSQSQIVTQLAVILSQPEQPLKYYQTLTNPQEIDRVFEDLSDSE